MDTTTIIAIVAIAAVVVVALAIAFMVLKRRRDTELESRYGAEYKREVKLRGRKKAEAEMTQREKRVSGYHIHALDPERRAHFAGRWTAVQAEFVDAPRTAAQHADVLLQEVMTARGYPMADFDQRAADLSVEYGDLVRNYRSAQEISQRSGSASTEDLRRALLMYRTMFETLLNGEDTANEEDRATEEEIEESRPEEAVV